MAGIGVAFLAAGLLIPLNAYASDWSAHQGITKTYAMAGTLGQLTVVASPFIDPASFDNHRDYMVYMNLFSTQSVGAGWFALKSGGVVSIYTLQYWYDTSGVNHNLVSTIPVGSTFTAKVEQQTNSASNCWLMSTYGGTNFTRCFPNTTTPVNNAGETARTKPPHSFSSGTNDMPGLFDFLQVGKWSGGFVVYGDYFSGGTTNNYKCYAGHGYVLDNIASYTGGTTDDKVGTGPRIYTTNDCMVQNPGYEAWGE
ncbi:hypothetical protein NWT39_05790 [Nitrososphaera viennensis]|nr:hypothetical protein [Nitrososphaera viennensis]UVS70295.1 hypothetical protein NWT39_05790 [Nitrososphaera viennensis]